MYFNRMTDYFERQSSNRYSIMGSSPSGEEVHGWVKVRFNEARYGRDFCGSIVCNNTWFLIRDAMSYWVQGQLAAGKTTLQIADYLRQFDKWDRYDLDGDGNFDEPDGFIDHFQIVHAGGDQAAGDPHQGTDAIWSHRWYAAVQGGGPGGLPGVNIGSGGASGGCPAVSRAARSIWVGDYTIQPENGGLGVFTHEYAGHAGSPRHLRQHRRCRELDRLLDAHEPANIGDGGPNGIGDAPVDLGAWGSSSSAGWAATPAGREVLRGRRLQGAHEPEARPERRCQPAGPSGRVRAPARQAARHRHRRPEEGSTACWSTMGDEIERR